MSWTDDRVETLKRMWLEGASASTIAKELGSVTRNAVIGKVHRLGLSNRGGEAEAAEPLAEATPGPVAAPPAREPAHVAAPAAPVAPAAVAAAPAPAPEPVELEPDAPADDEPDDIAAEPAAPLANAPIPFRRPIPGQPQPPAPSEISPEAMAKMREVEATAKRLSLMELTEKTCKWPVGDPATPNFWFCGTPVQAGKPYCEAHVAVAFQPMSARRDRRR